MVDNSDRTDHTLEGGQHANHGYRWCGESSTVPKVGPVMAPELLEAQMAELRGSLMGKLVQKTRREFEQSSRESREHPNWRKCVRARSCVWRGTLSV